jgi:uncharacterized membrane protein YqgA involved in biofilm formation
MPTGVFIDCLCVLCGGIAGATLQKKVPQKINAPLTAIFGVCAMAIGMVSLIKLHSLPAVILALIAGACIGECLNLDGKIKGLFSKALGKLRFQINGERDAYLSFYLIVAVTFCASGTNIFGAINEGISGDNTILLAKAAMDIFASFIFATTLGYAMLLIVIPQCLFLSLCFYAAQPLMSVISATMLADFVAVGGLITFILGLNIAKIKEISAGNLLPSLVLAFPVSYLFSLFL